jgi:hypothetical protein
LFAQKKKQEKGTLAVPAFQASFRFSLLTGRWKLGYASDKFNVCIRQELRCSA